MAKNSGASQKRCCAILFIQVRLIISFQIKHVCRFLYLCKEKE